MIWASAVTGGSEIALRHFAGDVAGAHLSSGVAAVSLQNLDLVTVRILYEEKLGHQGPFAVEFLDGRGAKARGAHARMLAHHVVRRHGKMAI